MKAPGRGWGKMVIYVAVALVAAWMLIYSPSQKGLSSAQTEQVSLEGALSNSKTLMLDADSATITLSKQALKTDLAGIEAIVADAKVPASAVTVSGKSVKINYTAPANTVAQVTSLLTGTPTVDAYGQIRGEQRIFAAQMEIKGAGLNSILLATLTPVEP